MDPTPIPFPTLSQQPDEVHNGDARPGMPSRVHSSPSLPTIWLPQQNSPIPPHLAHRLQVRYRPHLRPLDLAASPDAKLTKKASRSPTSAKGNAHSSYHSSSLLTPPLTPSSSFNSNTNEVPSTPPEQTSPLRWIQSADRAYGDSINTNDAQYSPTGLKGSASLPQVGYLTPSSIRSHSLSSEAESGYSLSPATPGADMFSALAASLGNMDVTPRDERKMNLDAQCLAPDASPIKMLNLESEKVADAVCSRFLLVGNIPSSAQSGMLRTAFAPTGDIKGILVRFQATHGVIILAFFDIRHAARARKQIVGQTFPGLQNTSLEASFISSARLKSLIGKSAFVEETDGSLFVSVQDAIFDPASLRNVLTSFGELKSFQDVGLEVQDQTYLVEYYDVRDADSAVKALNNRTILGARLRLFVGQEHHSAERESSDDPFQVSRMEMSAPPTVVAPMDNATRACEGRIRPRSVSASETMGAPDAVRRLRGRESPLEHSRRSSNDLFFDAIGKVPVSPQTPCRPRSISIGPDDLPASRSQRGNGGYDSTYRYSEHYYPSSYPDSSEPTYNAPTYSYPHSGNYHPDDGTYRDLDGDGASVHWAFAASPASAVEYYIPPSPRGPTFQQPQIPPTTPRKSYHAAQRQGQVHTSHHNAMDRDGLGPFGAGHGAYTPQQYSGRRGSTADLADGEEQRPHGGAPNNSSVGEKNQVNLALIEDGVDMRTTVMIKNIPNKMSDKDLLAFINKVCPRKIDFLYLRMDFQNGCNVGYAFVNFITVGDLLHFAKTQLGVKWNMYSSEKVLQMCYATYQGKEALVEKFKNSCIMDEREAWRPKIFYSDGPSQGLPEPFPPPTHLRRKERSSHNRGALYVPGTHQSNRRDGGHSGSTLYHQRPHPPRLTIR